MPRREGLKTKHLRAVSPGRLEPGVRTKHLRAVYPGRLEPGLRDPAQEEKGSRA